MPRLLTDEEITRQLVALPAWQRTALPGPASLSRTLSTASHRLERLPGRPEGAAVSSAITADFTFADFAAALEFVVRVGAEAEEMNHHPDVDIRWNRVTLALWTHSAGGLTQLDIELAHRISGLAP